MDHGEARFGPARTPVRAPALVVFGDGEVVEAEAGDGGGRFLLAAARPLHEPIARYGPFVMNTRAEIEQTLDELRSGPLHPEGASRRLIARLRPMCLASARARARSGAGTACRASVPIPS